MMKKLFSLLLAFLLLFSIAACHEEKQTETTPETTKAPQQSETPPEPEPEPLPPPEPQTFILLDDENFHVEVTDLKADAIWGYTLTVLFENRTDKACTLTFDNASINDVLVSGLSYIEAEAGATQEGEFTFLDADLELFGITEITKIYLLLNIFDSETYDDLYKEPAVIYPLGEDAVVPYERTPQPDDRVLVDKNGIQIILTGIDPDDTFGYALKLYIVNKTETNLMLSLDETKLNGKECYALWAITLPSQTHAYTDILWMEETLTDENIAEITSVLLKFYISDADNWLADPIVKETVEFIP